MGNSISKHRENSTKPEVMIVTIKAVMAFKRNANVKSRKNVDEQIQSLLESKFKRKGDCLQNAPERATSNNVLDFRDETTDNEHGEVDSNQGESSGLMDYVKRSKVVGISSDFSITDTRVAWNALREFSFHERRPTLTGFKEGVRKLSNVLGFARRSEVNPVQDMLTVEEIVPYWSNTPLDPWQVCCDICNAVPKGSPASLIPCRLCTKVFHRECLEKQGRLSDAIKVEAVELANTEIGWSCPTCESLFWLLSDSEKIDLMELFDTIDENQDSLITQEEYLNYLQKKNKDLLGMQLSKYREEEESAIYSEMDRDSSGLIDWWEFMTPMCVKILMKKNKKQLIRMLVPREVEKIRRCFRAYDPTDSGTIPMEDSKQSFRHWYTSLINRPAVEIPIVEWLEGYNKNDIWSELAKPEICWGEYLARYVLFVLAARPNTASQRPYVPRYDTVLEEDWANH